MAKPNVAAPETSLIQRPQALRGLMFHAAAQYIEYPLPRCIISLHRFRCMLAGQALCLKPSSEQL